MKLSKEDYIDYDLENLTRKDLLSNPSLAIGLAEYNYEFGKHRLAQDIKVLELRGGKVAETLAWRSGENGWAKTPAAQKKKVLSMSNEAVVSNLAYWSNKNGWGKTDAGRDLEISKMCDGKVGYWLKKYSKESFKAREKGENNWVESKLARKKSGMSFGEDHNKVLNMGYKRLLRDDYDI